MKKALFGLFFGLFFVFFLAMTFSIDPSSENYDLNGYTVNPSQRASSTNYTLLDVGIGESGITQTSGDAFSGDIGFARRIGNFPPDVNVNSPNGGECITGTHEIDFNVQDKDNSKLFARIAYSSTALNFENDINTEIVLNNYAKISDLNCSNPNWSKSRTCTFQWNTSGISDGNYFVDLNVWDVAQKAANQDSSDSSFIIDHTPPTITISTPNASEETSDVLVEFEVDNGIGCAINRSSIRVELNGTQSNEFNASNHCTFSQGSYSCSYYETSLYGGDWNLAVIAQDNAGHEAQEEVSFTFVPIVVVAAGGIEPSGVFVQDTTQISFDVKNTARNTLYASLYYSSTRGSKENAIATNLNLNNHSSIEGLNCVDTNWSDFTNCTYQWDINNVSDGNYFIDIYLENEGGDTGSNSAVEPFLLDSTDPQASVSGVSQTFVYRDTIYLNCRDDGSGCKPTKWYYFSSTANCSSLKEDYTNSTIKNSLTISTDHNDYLCLWVEDRVDRNDFVVSSQLHVDPSVYVVSGTPSETMVLVTQDWNNECKMYIDQDITVGCDFKSTVQIREWQKDLNRVWEGSPNLVISPERKVRVLLQDELEAFSHPDYFLKFESDQRTITSKGSEKNYPITIIRRRVIPLLTESGELEIGTLTIKIRQR